MLSHVLGVLIAFVSVILVLSMMVTGLVQATQSVLRLRSRNLLKGVGSILRAHTSARSEDRWALRRHAARVLNSPELASVDAVRNPETFWRQSVLGPKVSWVAADELARAIRNDSTLVTTTPKTIDSRVHERGDVGGTSVAVQAAKTSESMTAQLLQAPERSGLREHARGATTVVRAKEVDPLEQDIRRAAPAWRKRFQYFARLIAIAWSLVVAVAFQVSAPALLSPLNTDPEQARKFAGSSNDALSLAQVELADGESDLTSDRALMQLSEQHPIYAVLILEAADGAASKSQLIGLLEDVLPDDAQRPAILRTYGELTDDAGRSAERAQTGVDLDALEEQLAAFDITFWKDPYFYRDREGRWRADAIIGVLLTTILLCFGAPFWFEQLRYLAALRDLRAPASASTSSTLATARIEEPTESDSAR